MSSEPRAHRPAAGRLPIVELIGTPGAGKTTLSTEIVELLQEGGWAASTIVGAARDHARRTSAGRLVVRHTSGRVQRLLLWWLFYVLASMHALVFLFEERQLSRTVLGTQLRRPIRVARRVQICFWFFQLAGRQRFLRATARVSARCWLWTTGSCTEPSTSTPRTSKTRLLALSGTMSISCRSLRSSSAFDVTKRSAKRACGCGACGGTPDVSPWVSSPDT